MSTAQQHLVPGDPHDAALAANAHPAGWETPTAAARYDLVVIGGGTAGLVSALGGAGLGARVALVEKHLLGGDCLNYGCVPSKGVIRAARAVQAVREAGEFGVRVTEPQVNFAAAMVYCSSSLSLRRPNSSRFSFAVSTMDILC